MNQSLLVFLFLLVVVIRAKPSRPRQRPPDNRSPDLRQRLEDACGKELETLCPNKGMVWQLYCLYSYPKEQLSESCQIYLGTSTLGGCNEEAKTLCGDYESVSDILSCLQRSKEKLGSDCLRNIQSSLREDNPMKMMEDAVMRSTLFITVVGAVCLAIALLLACYALFWTKKLSDTQNVVLNQRTSDWKDASDKWLEETRQSSNHGCCLSFQHLNYWTVEGSPQVRKQILNNVSGQLEAGKVTAIMGPSGSGKTTLLKLIGGQMFSGEFSGSRAINGNIYSRNFYDEQMRRQGFVAQHDGLLSTLRVWETIMFAALLRLPTNLTVIQKLQRAAHVMNDVQLSDIRNSLVGDHNGSESSGGSGGGLKCISGGQRRRLSIALEVLANPATILLDEPTSGLDGSSALKTVDSLRYLSRQYSTTIGLTIHQPREEVFQKFDNLLVLGPEGMVVYYGKAKDAVAFFENTTGKKASGKSSGDFIIDCLGGADETEFVDHEQGLSTSTSSSFASNDQTTNFAESSASDEPNSSRVEDHLPRSLDSNRDGAHPTDRIDPFDENPATACHRAIESSDSDVAGASTIPQIAAKFQESSYGTQLSTSLSRIFGSDGGQDDESVSSERNGGWILRICRWSSNNIAYSRLSQEDGDIELQPVLHGRHQLRDFSSNDHSTTASIDQVLAIFARRFTAFMLNGGKSLYLFGQILLVGVVVSWTFSYKVATEIELPYQVLMLISLISLYAMIVQYLLLTPEYMVERQIIIRDVMSGYVSVRAYMIALMLTDIPRGMMHSLVLGIILYTIHPLNPNVITICFAAVCLMIGVSSWQGLIAMCSVVTDSISVAYSVVFLVLSSGTLFGGLLVRVEKIPAVFKIFYHISVAAVTQRALITNDMQCCYLTATCNSIANDLRASEESHQASIFSRVNATTTFCPPGLEYTGDGSDIGNLGRCYLMGLGLEEDHPVMSLVVLIVTSIIFRIIAGFILKYRLTSKDALIKVSRP